MQFDETLRQLRLELGLTQQDIAEQTHVSDSYIRKVKNERLQFGDYPSETFIQRVAEERKEDRTDQTVGWLKPAYFLLRMFLGQEKPMPTPLSNSVGTTPPRILNIGR